MHTVEAQGFNHLSLRRARACNPRPAFDGKRSIQELQAGQSVESEPGASPGLQANDGLGQPPQLSHVLVVVFRSFPKGLPVRSKKSNGRGGSQFASEITSSTDRRGSY